MIFHTPRKKKEEKKRERKRSTSIATHNLEFDIHTKLRSITLVATKVHVILWSFVVLTRMHDIIELVYEHYGITQSATFLMVWCGPLHLASPGDVAYACTNTQQVA